MLQNGNENIQNNIESSSNPDTTQLELQRKYGTNWSEENFTTILDWICIAAFYIESLEKSIIHYRNIIRNNVVLGLVLSTGSGTIGIAQYGLNNNSSLSFVLNSLFTVMSFTIAICAGTIKIYQIQERLENFIKIKHEWIVFSTSLATELQLPVELRKDALYVIIKNKNKYLDLLKIDDEIPDFIKEKVKKSFKSNQNFTNLQTFDLSSLADIILKISFREKDRFLKKSLIKNLENNSLINKLIDNKDDCVININEQELLQQNNENTNENTNENIIKNIYDHINENNLINSKLDSIEADNLLNTSLDKN